MMFSSFLASFLKTVSPAAISSSLSFSVFLRFGESLYDPTEPLSVPIIMIGRLELTHVVELAMGDFLIAYLCGLFGGDVVNVTLGVRGYRTEDRR